MSLSVGERATRFARQSQCKCVCQSVTHPPSTCACLRLSGSFQCKHVDQLKQTQSHVSNTPHFVKYVVHVNEW